MEQQKKTENMQAYQREYYQKRKLDKNRVMVTLSKSEYRTFSRLAKKANKTIAETIKTMALHSIDPSSVLVDDQLHQTILESVRQIRSIGNNINQMSHHLNSEALKSTGIPYPHLEQAILQSYTLLSALETHIKQTMEPSDDLKKSLS